MRDCVHGVGHSPVCQILFAISITDSPTFLMMTSAGMLPVPAASLFFNILMAAFTSL